MILLPTDVSIRHDFRPGDIGYITYLHGITYAQEYGWDYTFEAYVAGPLSEFVKSPKTDEKIWIVEKAGTICGCVAVVRASEHIAQLRWLLLLPDLRGLGIGRLLMEDLIQFCQNCGYRQIILWTTSDLTTAANLYRQYGFTIQEEVIHFLWGKNIIEHKYSRLLA